MPRKHAGFMPEKRSSIGRSGSSLTLFRPMHVWTVQLKEIKKPNSTLMELNIMKEKSSSPCTCGQYNWQIKKNKFYVDGIKYNERQHLRKQMVHEPTEDYEKRTDTWPCSPLNRAMNPINECKPPTVSCKRFALFSVVVEFTNLWLTKSTILSIKQYSCWPKLVLQLRN